MGKNHKKRKKKWLQGLFMARINCPRYPSSKRKIYKWENETEKKC